MPELLVLVVALAVAGVLVLRPLWWPRPAEPESGEADAAALRHRVALEALRDVEADRRAGSLDDAAYAEQLADAEARAAETRAALVDDRPEAAPTTRGGGRGWAVVAAGGIAGILLVAAAFPGTGVGNRTEVNATLAEAQAREADRQERVAELQAALATDPDDARVLSDLADAHLAGSSQEDLVRAAVALQLLIRLEPERADAYERIMAAYLRAGDVANARAAHDSYVELETADPVEEAFFDGLIARAEGDGAAAAVAFDRFLELAPDDARAGMVRGLRDEVEAGS